MKKLIIILFFLFVFNDPSHSQRIDDTCLEDTVRLSTATGEISGSLLHPVIKKKIPVVLIIAGSGPTDRNGNNPRMKNNSLKYLAQDLCRNQIASLRYDKRGVGASSQAGINEIELRFEDYVRDAAGWILQLKQDGRFSGVIVVGHSEGSLVGMLASQQEKPSGYISIAGPSDPADKLIRAQLKNQPEEVKNYIFPILDSLLAGSIVDNVNTAYQALLRPSVQPYLISWFRYSPRIEIGKLSVPILIVHGSADIQVDPQNAFELLYSSKNVDLEIIQGMNHILKPSETDRQKNLATYNNPDLPVMDGLIRAIVTFIKTRL